LFFLKKMKIFTLSLLFSVVSIVCSAQNVTLNLQGIRSSKGQIEVSIYKNADQFNDEKPSKYLYFSKDNLKDGNLKITFSLAEGNYGVTVLDDEDMSRSMTFKMGFYPKEGVAFSNFRFKGMSKPKFEDFKFQVSGVTSINGYMRYF